MCFTVLKFKRVISWDSVGDIRVLKHHQFRSVFFAIGTPAINVNFIRPQDFLLDGFAPKQSKRATQKYDHGFHIHQYRENSAKCDGFADTTTEITLHSSRLSRFNSTPDIAEHRCISNTECLKPFTPKTKNGRPHRCNPPVNQNVKLHTISEGGLYSGS
jgi:hypothetical protein